jgi:hypothetical protein
MQKKILTKQTHQQEDKRYAKLLNNLRKCKILEDDLNLRKCKILEDDLNLKSIFF